MPITKTITLAAKITHQDIVEALVGMDTEDLAPILYEVAKAFPTVDPISGNTSLDFLDLGEEVCALPVAHQYRLSRFLRALDDLIVSDDINRAKKIDRLEGENARLRAALKRTRETAVEMGPDVLSRLSPEIDRGLA